MAKTEGKCPNCGSIIQFDKQAERVRCIFCWGESDREEAEALMVDDSAHVYANESFEAPDDDERHELLMRQRGGQTAATPVKKTKTANKVQTKKRKDDEPSAVEKIKSMKKTVVRVPKVPTKKWLILTGIVTVLIVLFVAISVPLYMKRVEARATLEREVLEHSALKLEDQDAFAIDGLHNQSMLLVSRQTVKQEDAEKVAKIFYEAYETAYGDAAKTAHLQLRLLSNEAAFEAHIDGGTVTVEAIEQPIPEKVEEKSEPSTTAATSEEKSSSTHESSEARETSK
ncbi:MAG: hypothetical protein Q4P72_03785 [Eubacteriales bacterium]|nr:hypothetical protein [Eubacteriales bacterium]